MTKRLSIAVSLAAAIVAAGLFVAGGASADTKTDYDYSVGNGSGTYFVHNGPPLLGASVYAGNDIAGGVTNTSFTIGWTTYAPGYRIWVRSYCNVGGIYREASLWIHNSYEAVVSAACASGVWYARGQITH